MNKILIVAKRDYLAAVRTKAFVIGLLVAPLLFGGGFLALFLMRGRPDARPKRIAIVDRTGISAAAVAEEIHKANPGYVCEPVQPGTSEQNLRRILSDRVRSKELTAFIEIEAGKPITWYSNESGFNPAQRTLAGPVNDGLRRARMAQLGMGAGRIHELLDPLPLESMSLVVGNEMPRRKATAENFAAPLAFGFLMMMILMPTAGAMLPAIAEDKMQRVFEMLLVSATSFELVAGKVLASIAAALTSSVFYVLSVLFLMQGMAVLGLAPFELLPWFLVYLVADVAMLSAIAAAFGSMCSSGRDAQNFAMFVLSPVLIPMFLMVPVMQQPNGAAATALSLFPLFTPILMIVRQATPAGVPGWQPWVGLAGIAVTTLAICWVASRIFRLGILMQGKRPSVRDLMKSRG